MTTRFSGFQVTLRTDIREDDAEHIISAIRMIKGVMDVRPIEADCVSPIEIRIRCEVAEKLRIMSAELLK